MPCACRGTGSRSGHYRGLLAGTYGPDPGEEDAIVTCTRTPGGSDATTGELAPYDWSCALRIPGGGAQALRLGFDRAPEDGYEETLHFNVSAADPRWDDRDDRDLILRFDAARASGRPAGF